MKGVIFDFDGPIFPGREAAHIALTATYEEFADRVCGRPGQNMANAPLFAPPQMIDAAYAEFNLPRERLTEIRDYYTARLMQEERKLGVSPEVSILLSELLDRGRKLAILSSRVTANLVKLLTVLGLSSRFAAVVGSNGDRDHKLNPVTIPNIATQLGLDKSDVVLVGDSDSDYRAARNAGMPYYHAAWTGEPSSEALAKATAVVSSVADLRARLMVLR